MSWFSRPAPASDPSVPGAAPSASTTAAHAPLPSAGLTRDHVVWAYRLLLDREPEGDDVIGPKLRGCPTTASLRAELMNSAEFRQKNPDYAHTNDHTIVVKLFENGLRLALDLADHVIGLAILRDRYERDELRFVERTVRPGQHVVDVGAHIGFFAMHLARLVGPTGSVDAFEPFPPNATLLEQSVAENRVEAIVRLHRRGVGARSGTLRLAFARETLNTGGAYLVTEGRAPLEHLDTAEVEVVALDAAALPRPVSFLKMDVEGAEPLVIEGARNLLSRDRPIVLSELHREQLARVTGTTPAAVIETMAGLGYRCHTLAEGGEGVGEAADPDTLPAVASVVFVPRAEGH